MSVQSLLRKPGEEVSSVAFEVDESLCLGDSLISSHDFMITLTAEFVLDFTFACELSDGDPDRDTDQVSIIELDARSLIAVVYHDFNAHTLEFLLDIISESKLCLILGLDDCYDNMIRSYGQWPDDPLVIVMLLYDSLHGSGDAYSVASHPVWMIFALLILEGSVHAFRIFETELEDLSDLDASSELDRLAAVRTWIAFLKSFDICDDVSGVISAVAYAEHMVVFLIGTGAHVDCADELGVNYYDTVLESDRTGESGNASGERSCNILVRELDIVLRNIECIDKLGHVELSVTSYETCDIIFRLKVCVICSEHKGLDRLLHREMQIISDVLDSLGSRCEYNLCRLHLFDDRFLICKLSSLYSCCHSAFIAVQDVGFAPVGKR